MGHPFRFQHLEYRNQRASIPPSFLPFRGVAGQNAIVNQHNTVEDEKRESEGFSLVMLINPHVRMLRVS
jgi:hypothetical protein